MTISNFNPTIWSKALLANLNKTHCFADKMNRDYEGEIKSVGDTVKINSIGRIAVKSYTRNSGLGGTGASPTIPEIDRPEILTSASQFLTIDQGDYFNFGIDDVDKWQQNPKLMAAAMKEAAYAMSNEIDLFAGTTLQNGVAPANVLAQRTIGTGAGDDDAYETLVDLKVKLRENDVNDDMLWAMVPPWFYGMLEKDPRFTNYGTDKNREALTNGLKGGAAGFDICVSNNISGSTAGTLAVSGGVHTIIAGSRSAATYAEQLNKIEAFRPEGSFADAMKGLHLYGAKVLRPYALAAAPVVQA